MMIKATVGDLLDGKLDALSEAIYAAFVEGKHYRLYAVRDGDTVFYVGQSKDVVARLLTHVGLGTWGASGLSQLGETIELNLPESRQWQIELYQVERPGLGLDVPERELIQRLCPYLNCYGGNGDFLPDRYKDPRLQNAQARRPPAVYDFDLNGLAKAPVQKRLDATA